MISIYFISFLHLCRKTIPFESRFKNREKCFAAILPIRNVRRCLAADRNPLDCYHGTSERNTSSFLFSGQTIHAYTKLSTGAFPTWLRSLFKFANTNLELWQFRLPDTTKQKIKSLENRKEPYYSTLTSRMFAARMLKINLPMLFDNSLLAKEFRAYYLNRIHVPIA